MKISLQQAGKRYNREWIFRRFNYNFTPGNSYAITGSNGSGKSTLLQVIAGAVLHSEGIVEYEQMRIGHEQQVTGNKKVEILLGEKAYRQISIAAPYLELIEEMSANEFLQFHAGFKPLKSAIPEILYTVGLAGAADKQIRYYSSGMKQRLKLAQAFFSDTSVLLLDEPLTNLDEEGIAVYKKLWNDHTAERLVIVSSNDRQEYERCGDVIKIGDFK